MSADDYYDPHAYHSPAPVMGREHQSISKPKKSNKNKNIEWTTRQGEIIRVADMEDSHLGNTICYLHRKLETHAKAAEFMVERGFTVPPCIINKRPVTEWLDIFGKEAVRRANKEMEKAKRVLGAL